MAGTSTPSPSLFSTSITADPAHGSFRLAQRSRYTQIVMPRLPTSSLRMVANSRALPARTRVGGARFSSSDGHNVRTCLTDRDRKLRVLLIMHLPMLPLHASSPSLSTAVPAASMPSWSRSSPCLSQSPSLHLGGKCTSRSCFIICRTDKLIFLTDGSLPALLEHIFVSPWSATLW